MRAEMIENTPASCFASDDTSWAVRSRHWLEQSRVSSGPRKESDRPLLILSGHGVRLYVDNGGLIVQNGLTHFPQKREEWRFFSGEWRVPSRIVVLDGKGGLTFHALRWLAEQNVPLVHIDWKGNVVHVAGGSGYAINAKLAEAQEAARNNGRWLTVSRQLISLKIANCIETLRSAFPKAAAADEASSRLSGLAREMKYDSPSTVDDLRGVEGRAAIAYFAAWHSFPLRWKGTGRRAIPDDWRHIGRRLSMAGNRKSYRNRNATHPVNAMLNYAYGMLENQVRMHIVAAGLDPTIGYFHGDYRDKHALVYDLMEPLRPIADKVILNFVERNTFSPADIMVTREGICRLNPQLARSIVRAIGDFSEARDLVRRCLLQIISL